MSNSIKNMWWIYLLIAAGIVILVLSMHSSKPQNDQGVVLNDIFHQPAQKEVRTSPAAEPKKADPVPPMAIVATPTATGHETDFTIQVYSFQDKNRAETALQSLKNSGYQAFIIMSDLGEKGIWYRVRVAGIADEKQAHQMLEEIRKNYNSGFILKPQK